jgi:Cu+-exporting ATPase
VFVMLVAGVAQAGGAPGAEPAFTGRVDDKSRVCMMQDSLQPKVGVPQEHEGKKYWFCCPMCLQAFNADPLRYAHARDPVSGATVDKANAPAFAVAGKVYFFQSEDNLKRFSENPSRYP